jgi:hypothetical protein
MGEDGVDGPGVADAVPGIDPESYEAPVLFTLTVEGELFAVGRAVDGGTSYDWASGPNEGYGYGSSASPDRPQDEHIASIRGFLRDIDPATGYLAE